MKRATWFLFGFVTVALPAMMSSAMAQESYPSSPVKLVVGYPGGSPADVIVRLLGQKISTQMNGSVIVENRLGAAGNIAAESVAKARPDGYTLLFNLGTMVLSSALGQKLNYDLLKDFSPVSLVAAGPQLIVVHPSVPANTVPEFIAYVKANPNKLAYGSSGIGSLAHMATLLFLQSNGLAANHVPYKGAPLENTDLAAGRIQFSFSAVASVLPLVKEKRVKALAITSLKRSRLLPDVPTLAETIPGFEIVNWYGVMAPAKTPRPIVQKLNSEITKALEDPEMISRLQQDDAVPRSSTPEEYAAYLKSELDRWTKVVREGGIRVEE